MGRESEINKSDDGENQEAGDPADEILDYLGLPRESKLEVASAILEAMSDQTFAEYLEETTNFGSKQIKPQLPQK